MRSLCDPGTHIGSVSSLCSQKTPGGEMGLNFCGHRKLTLDKTRG